MNHLYVADVGNSRIKWGCCPEHEVVEMVSLPLDQPTDWEKQWQVWGVDPAVPWCLGGVNPAVEKILTDWLRRKGAAVRVIDHHRQLGMPILVQVPEKVGLDRLLNAMALQARPYRERGRPAIIVSVGSAVTVDLVDETGQFLGGTIFPGLRLMSQALHAFTAKLPQVPVSLPLPTMPGKSTEEAIRLGVFGAVVGGIERLCREIATTTDKETLIYLTGGDGKLLEAALDDAVISWPTMTLEGLRLAAVNSDGN